MITRGSRVTFHEDDEHAYKGEVVEVLSFGEQFQVRWDDTGNVDVCMVDELEEN